MSSKQTRKSVSISGELYLALRQEAEVRCTTGSGMVEAVMRKYLGMPERTVKPKKPRSIGRPVTKLKISGPPVEGTNVEVIRTEVHVAVDPKEQLKLDRKKEFKKWEDKQPKLTPDQKRASNIFTF